MTSTGQLPEPWKSTTATLFNPYLNLNQITNHPRQQSIRILTPIRHSRVPPESLVGTGNFKSEISELIKKDKNLNNFQIQIHLKKFQFMFNK